MATRRWWQCATCRLEDAKKWPSMFGALQQLATNLSPPCKHCQASMRLHLDFAFALGVGARDTIALAAFQPMEPPKWTDNGREVTFFPFLVIVKRADVRRAVWLPYFHIVFDPKTQRRLTKYGQWAPFMDEHVFRDLLQQARQARLWK